MPLSVGDRLGPYQIVAPIGAGGMGEVYKARDTRLHRIVAIKQLRGKHAARFEQEARAIAALNHPHVCQIYDVGQDYLVMEYVEGKPLNGPLRIGDAVKLALQIAGALEEAHAAGILHRDLKPANILVTAKGASKLLDFGLAKLTTVSDSDATQSIEGTVTGTAPYMSPEQAQGKALDERSDIFSFGVVLYELVSGTRPFKGASTLETLNAVVREDPAPLESPVAPIVTKCLAKQPAQRFQNMAELKTALEQILVTKPVDRQVSIAVLPFANMSASQDDEYFSDGLAEEILNLLVHIPDLKVTARTSAFAFRGKEQDVTEVANKLHVSTILEGSVRRAGSRIRVIAQLVNGADGYHIWSERYDREMTDVFAVQDEIAAKVANALHIKLGPKATLPRYQPKVPAYEAFLKARHLMSRTSLEGLARGREYLEQAIALDPEHADPYAELAYHFILLGSYGLRPVHEVMPLARAMAMKVRYLDPSASRTHAELAVLAAILDFDWISAETHLQRAKEAGALAPEWLYRCAFWILVPQGRFVEAIREIRISLEQDPLNALFRSGLAFVLLLAGQYEGALVEAGKALELNPSAGLGLATMAGAYAVCGRFAEAREPAEKMVGLAPWDISSVQMLAGILSRLGEQERASELIGQCKDKPLFSYHIVRSEFEAALDSCEMALDQRDPNVPLFAAFDFLKPMRENPRWPAIAGKMNLPAAASNQGRVGS